MKSKKPKKENKKNKKDKSLLYPGENNINEDLTEITRVTVWPKGDKR